MSSEYKTIMSSIEVVEKAIRKLEYLEPQELEEVYRRISVIDGKVVGEIFDRERYTDH